MQYIRFSPANFLVDTQGLNGSQTKAYLVAVSLFAHNEKPFQSVDDLARAFVINRVASRLAVAKKMAEFVLTNFFINTTLGWVHKEISRQIECFTECKNRWLERLQKARDAKRAQVVRQKCTPVFLKNQGLADIRMSDRTNDSGASLPASAPSSSSMQVPSSDEQSSPQTSRKGLITLVGRYCDERDLANLPEKITQYLFADEERGIQIMEWIIANGINLEEYVF